MGKIILAVAIAGSVGYLLGSLTSQHARAVGAAEEDIPKLARMARDTRLMCRDITPTLEAIEAAYADGTLGTADLGRITRQLQRLI